MKPKDREQLLMVIAAAAAGLLIVVYLILPPIQSWWSDRQTQIRQLRTAIADGNGFIRRADSLRSQWSEMTSNALPATMSEAEQKFLKAVDGWSGDSGAQIASIMPQWKIESTNYMTLNCRVETAGDLGSLTKFLYDLETGPLAVRLDTVELSAHDNNGQQMTMGVDLNGLALLQP